MIRMMKKNKKYLTTTEAIPIAGVTKVTLINWCKEYKIGKKVVGRWRIDPAKLQRILKNEKNN